MRKSGNVYFFVGAVLAGLGLSGCPKAKGPVVAEPVKEDAVVEAPASVVPEGPGLNVGADWGAAPGILGVVPFDYMKSELTEDARSVLKKNAVVLKAAAKAASGLKVRVEGHCDDRGTLEYNMALGERRAKAVRDYYASLGVAKGILSTISYGEERPVCSEATEGCWAQNRRGETTVRASAPIRVPLAQ